MWGQQQKALFQAHASWRRARQLSKSLLQKGAIGALAHTRRLPNWRTGTGQAASCRDRGTGNNMATPEQVVAAVHALYHGANLTQQAQANHWLTAFQQSAEAWQVPFALLVPEQPEEVQFFAATLLVRKVRTDWSKLEAGSRQGLSQAIR